MSDDGLVATIRLRDGLLWRHDGKPVTAEDCIALAEAMGGARRRRPEICGIRCRIQSRRRPHVPDRLQGKIRFAARDALQAERRRALHHAETRRRDRSVQSRFPNPSAPVPSCSKADEWKPGDRVVYVKNPNYKPRPEPAPGLAGGKVALVDRIEMLWIPDPQTQVNALLSGEIDMIES